MADQTAIEWCDSTFNPWIGCSRVSPACDDCYAARSTPARTLGVAWGPGEPRRRTSDDLWKHPARWNAKRFMQCGQCGWRGERAAAIIGCGHCGSVDLDDTRRRVFCASLADWLDNKVHIQWLVDLLELVRSTPDLDWLLLSKRIGNWSSRISEAIGYLDEQTPAAYPLPLRRWLCQWLDGDEAPRNVWLGSTVVNQAEVDRDVPKLLATPAAVRFLSVEPMLGPVWVQKWLKPGCTRHGASFEADGKCEVCEGRGIWSIGDQLDETEKAPLHIGLSWVICGGESGPKARPMHPDWARSLRDQCAAAGVPFLFKQWGEWVPADDDCGTVVPVTEIVGDVQWQEGKRVQVQWLSPNDSIVGHSFARLGKKAAGRLLDGRTHDAWPGVRRG